jgi:hypothetical protein
MSILNEFYNSKYANCTEYKNAPCYRSLISIAFFEYYLHCLMLEDVKEEINNFTSSVRDREEYILRYDFDEDEPTVLMEFYPLEFLEGWGAVYVDHTHTCYPLILYPQAHKIKTSTRIDGFLHAVESIHGEVDKLLDLFLKYEIIRDLKNDEQRKLNWTNYHKDLHTFIHNKYS